MFSVVVDNQARARAAVLASPVAADGQNTLGYLEAPKGTKARADTSNPQRIDQFHGPDTDDHAQRPL